MSYILAMLLGGCHQPPSSRNVGCLGSKRRPNSDGSDVVAVVVDAVVVILLHYERSRMLADVPGVARVARLFQLLLEFSESHLLANLVSSLVFTASPIS